MQLSAHLTKGVRVWELGEYCFISLIRLAINPGKTSDIKRVNECDWAITAVKLPYLVTSDFLLSTPSTPK